MVNRWEDWEDEILRRDYPIHSINIPELSHRSAQAITTRARTLNVSYLKETKSWAATDVDRLKTEGVSDPVLIQRYGAEQVQLKAQRLGATCGSAWTAEEDGVLQKYYTKIGAAVAAYLPGRSKISIRRRAAALGLRTQGNVCGTWEPWELELLEKYYATKGTEIPELAHRSVDSIRHAASALGIRKYVSGVWPAEDIELLRKYYPTVGVDIPVLRKRYNERQITSKAQRLGIRRDTAGTPWTEEEDQLILDKYPEVGCDIPELRHRSTSSIIHRASRLGVQSPLRQVWSDEQREILCREYPAHGPDIPELLAIFPKRKIIKQANTLGLRIEERNKPWTPEEERIIDAHYESMTAAQLAELLPGRTEASIYAYINKRGKVKMLGQSLAWKAKAALVPSAPPEGYCYVKCSVCGKIFPCKVCALDQFSHTTHTHPIPDGWFAPVEHTRIR